jgi:hypothetical protein
VIKQIRFSIAFVAAIVAVVAAYCARPDASTIPEPLQAVPTTYNCGTIHQGVTAKANFHLTNKSSGPLRIVDILFPCTCTSSTIRKRTLNPGDSVELEVTWKVGDRRNKTSTDLLVLSTLGDKTLLRTRLTLIADVDPDINYDPPELIFEEGIPQEQNITLCPNVMKDLTVLEAYCTNMAFTASLVPEKAQVRVAFAPSQWHNDTRSSQLIVRTSSPNQPVCRIPLIVRSSRMSNAR